MTADLTKAIGKKTSILIDTLDSDFAAKANVVLPGVTWAEKSGTFENVHGRVQSFAQAIPAIEFARSEGQIALDLAALFGHSRAQRFNAAQVREQMGGIFVDQVHHPALDAAHEPDMAYVEF
jgi:predicted molibdopterin-dependent oxidoreductase YjgC